MTQNNNSFWKTFFSDKWVIVFICIILLALLMDMQDSKNLQKSGLYEIGTIYHVSRSNIRTEINYEYDVANKKYYRGLIKFNFSDFNAPAIGKKFIIIYDPENPKTSALVLSRGEILNIDIDSLNSTGIIEDIPYFGKIL